MSNLQKNLKKFSRDENGGVLIIFAAALPALIVLTALILDLSYIVDRKRRLQVAADAAAYAGATYVPIYGPNYTDLITLISNEVTASINNMFSSGNVPTITPPTNLDITTRPYTVTVNLKETVNGLLLGAANKIANGSISNSITITAQAKARALLAGDFCWIALSPTATGAFSLNGSNTVGTPAGNSCGIAVNSSASNAIDSKGSAVSVNVPVSVVGGYKATGNPPPLKLSYSYPVPDPYSLNGTKDVIKSMSDTAFGKNGNTKGSGTVPTSGAVNGAHYTDFSGNTVLPSGTYYIDNISLTGGTTVTTATGASVTIILSPNANVSFKGNSSISIRSPSSGNLEGVGITGMGTTNVTMTGTNDFSGAIYFPNGSVNMQGDFSSNCMQIISQTISISGNPTVGDSGCPAGTPKAQRFLVGLTQ